MNRIPPWLALTLLLASPAGASAQDEGPAEVVGGFHRALAAGDRDAALTLLAPDVMIFESGGAERSRDEYASHHLGADAEFAGATRREILDQQQGGDGEVAWVLTRSKTTGKFRDREIDSYGVETMILKKAPDGWRIAHIHWSSRPVKG